MYNNILKKTNLLHKGKRLDQVLVMMLRNQSRSQIKIHIINGKVKINGKICFLPKKKILGNEIIEIQDIIKKKECNYNIAQMIPLNIIYEDDHIIIINKQSNLVVHPGIGNINNTILNSLLYHFPLLKNVPRAGIVHRLDKNTTGLMIIAKTIISQNILIQSLKLRSIVREYEAIVIGNIISNGIIDKPISRHNKNRIKMSVNKNGKFAITSYKIIEKFKNYTHLNIRLNTGRTHQIRVHMSYINHPLVGDFLYGYRNKKYKNDSNSFINYIYGFNRQALHAITIKLYHPITKIKLKFNISLPEDMIKLISEIKKNDK